MHFDWAMHVPEPARGKVKERVCQRHTSLTTPSDLQPSMLQDERLLWQSSRANENRIFKTAPRVEQMREWTVCTRFHLLEDRDQIFHSHEGFAIEAK